MNLDEVTKRLAFIKYLYSVGEEQARKSEPLCWAAVLTFHDAVELFLQLVAEYVQLKERIKDIGFMEYWSLMDPCLKKLAKPEITQRIAMERLNKARVDFKHYGNPPSKTAITGDFEVNTKNFFEENTISIFGINFSDVSLLELVSCQDVKNDLRKAEELMNASKFGESLRNVAIAFVKLIDDYENRKRDKWGRSPFSFGENMTFMTSFHLKVGGDMGDFIDASKESIEALKEAVKIIGFGIDYKRYGMFKWLTPHVYHFMDGKYQTQGINEEVSKSLTANDVNFCINFVIESARALQQFDYALMHN
jgi:hypothetical protein